MDNHSIPTQRTHKNQRRSAHFLKMYGMAFRHYRKLFLRQRRRCAICGTKSNDPRLESEIKCDLYVDHCHTTGKVRGLLCQNCNSGLGFFKDNPDLLRSAVAYLMQTSAPGYSAFDGIVMPKEYRERVDNATD